PAPFNHYIDRQTMKPGCERGVAAKRVQFLPGADKHILGDFVRLTRAQHPAGEAVHPGYVSPVDPFERTGIARRGERHVSIRLRYSRRAGVEGHNGCCRHVTRGSTGWTASPYGRLKLRSTLVLRPSSLAVLGQGEGPRSSEGPRSAEGLRSAKDQG